jgi:hypothetical protein
MGYLQIIKDWDYCDSCDKPKPLATGSHTIVDGLSVTWQCEDCK